jgi:hypothetical protein
VTNANPVPESYPAEKRREDTVSRVESPFGSMPISRGNGRMAAPDSIVANFEFASPIRQAPLFIPMRLHLSYGAWTEKDGTRVLFSRDYKPLWRLKAGETPARLNPWDRIQFEKQEWFWDDTTTPWSNEARFEHEMNRLQDFGVTALPRLVETLPYLVLRDDLTSINDAVDLLRDKYDPVQAA